MKSPGGAPVRESVEDLYEHAPCGYVSTLPDGRILKVNGTFLQWTGFRREQLLGGIRFPELLGMVGRLFHETHLLPLLRVEGQVREIACDIRTREGALLPVLLNAMRRELPTPPGSRDPTAAVFRYMVLDATERRRYERELLEARRAAETALKRVRDLESLIPLCAWCRRVQDDTGAWLDLEAFLDAAGTQVTHSICGACAKRMEG